MDIQIPERHPAAEAGGRMSKLHDRYALLEALQLSYSFMSSYENEILVELLNITCPIDSIVVRRRTGVHK